MELEEIKDIPNSLVTCLINNNEIRIMKLSPKTLTIRTFAEITNIDSLRVCFYIFNKDSYEEIIIRDYEVVSKIYNDLYYVYSFNINEDRYKELVRYIAYDYSKYIRLKTQGIDNEFSMEMVKYKALEDYEFYDSYLEQKKDWLSDVNNLFIDNKIMKCFTLGIQLDNSYLYNSYLKKHIEEFKNEYLLTNYMDKHFLCKKDVSRLYVGNEFCHNLFPSTQLLLDIMEKAKDEKLDITIVFTYMKEELIKKTAKTIEEIYNFCIASNKKIEIVINDWGMLKLLQDKTDYIDINMGTLLNKRRKDPRMRYKNASRDKKQLLRFNNLNSGFFTQYLRDININRYEFEASANDIILPKNTNNTLHMPMYQTNTAEYCTLYAVCKNNNRGKQSFVTDCPMYCKEHAFLYSKHLNLVGLYNSLFAFNKEILIDNSILINYFNKGIDRIVLNFI